VGVSVRAKPDRKTGCPAQVSAGVLQNSVDLHGPKVTIGTMQDAPESLNSLHQVHGPAQALDAN